MPRKRNIPGHRRLFDSSAYARRFSARTRNVGKREVAQALEDLRAIPLPEWMLEAMRREEEERNA